MTTPSPPDQFLARWVRHRPALEIAAATLLTLVALGLRLYGLDAKSFWLDEVLTGYAVRESSLAGMLAKKRVWDVSLPPLSFLLTWLLRPLGESEFVIRLPEALAGAAAVPAVYALGRTLAGPRVGLTAALFMAVLPFSVHYGQEARPYAFLMLFTTLQMLATYRVTTSSRVRDWVAFALVSGANLYTHYLAFAALFASYAYIAVALLIWAARGRRDGGLLIFAPGWSATWRRLTLATAGMALMYAPWTIDLRAFFARPDMGLGRLAASVNGPLIARVRDLLTELSFEGALLAVLAVGLVTLVARAVITRGDLPSLLLLTWIVAPLVVLIIRGGAGVVTLHPRYWSFLFPACAISAAVGIHAVAGLPHAAMRWWADRRVNGPHAAPSAGAAPDRHARVVTGIVHVALVGLILIPIWPRLVREYGTPKVDYRAAAATIGRSQAPDATVISVGRLSGFATIGLGYYLTRPPASVRVVNAERVDDRLVEGLRRTRGPVWAAVEELPRGASEAGLEVHRFSGITIARPAESGLDARDPIAAADLLLRWAGTFHAPHRVSRSVFDALARADGVSDNLLPPLAQSSAEAPWRFSLQPGSSLVGQTIRLEPTNGMANAIFHTARVKPGETFITRFSYRNPELNGPQRVYVSAHDAGGRWLDVFPIGEGYHCEIADHWKTGAFGFKLPADTAGLVLWLRAQGTGSAEFSGVELRRVVEKGSAP